MAAMRKNKNSAGNAAPAARQEKKKLIRGIIFLVILAILITGLISAVCWLKGHMFENNKRFTLQQVEVSSTGYWGQDTLTTNRLLNKLDLHIGKSNLFDLDSGKIRKELRSIPNIADAQVKKVLPDTLEIYIEERIPRAFIGRPNSSLVTDANCVVMNTAECFKPGNLPVINGTAHPNMQAGEEHLAMRPALHLIMTAQRYKCFSVAAVNLRHPDNLAAVMYYRNGSKSNRYIVTMPRGNYAQWLDILQSAIEDARRRGDTRNKIDLTHRGQVVMSYSGNSGN